MRKQVTDLPLEGATVLLRSDLNVPINDKGHIEDNTKIIAALKTIKYLQSKNCKIVLLSHFGRPKGEKIQKLSLKPVAFELNRLGIKTKMAEDCVGPDVQKLVVNMQNQDVLLLENLRFQVAEDKPSLDPSFAASLAELGQFYINDAFASSHRASSSIVNITSFFKGKAGSGFLMEQEISMLEKTLKNPEHPFMAIIGGAKISTKVGVLKSLAHQVDTLAIGGAMAFTFLKAEGFEVGNSLVEPAYFNAAHEIISLCHEKGVDLLMPMDIVIGKEGETESSIVLCGDIPEGYAGFDIGPLTIKLFQDAMSLSKTILWNGPLGVFENPLYAEGTRAIGETFSQSKAITIAGGGETLAALKNIPHHENITHLSTGGGATLEFIEQGTLPGIEALTNVSSSR